MEKSPKIRINGTRYKAKTLKMGAYRQIVLLIDTIGEMDPEELKEDMVEVLRVTFGLTSAQADEIDAADVIPTFRTVTAWAQGIFTAKVRNLPNAPSPEPAPGD